MRVFVLVSALAVAFVVGAVAFAGSVGREVDPDRPWWDLHRPSSEVERAAATAGLRYARAVQRGDVTAACGIAEDRAARVCGSIRCDGDRVFHAQERGATIDVRLDTCHLTVARRAGAWVVVDQMPQVGLA